MLCSEIQEFNQDDHDGEGEESSNSLRVTGKHTSSSFIIGTAASSVAVLDDVFCARVNGQFAGEREPEGKGFRARREPYCLGWSTSEVPCWRCDAHGRKKVGEAHELLGTKRAVRCQDFTSICVTFMLSILPCGRCLKMAAMTDTRRAEGPRCKQVIKGGRGGGGDPRMSVGKAKTQTRVAHLFFPIPPHVLGT